jgi:uncharacterized protein (DUF2249 family)
LIWVKARDLQPHYFDDVMKQKTVTLDVREDIRRGREPFSKIMQAVGRLGEDENLRLIAPFEPAPLFAVLAQQGFLHQTKTSPEGDWEVLFFRTPEAASLPQPAAPAPRQAGHKACSGPPVLDVDARGLEPPQPLVKILEAVATLPKGVRLRARTDRRPMHLYAQLEERGFLGDSEEQPDGSFVTYVDRR